MTDMETLEKIKDKEGRAEKEVAKAKEEALKMVQSAKKEAERQENAAAKDAETAYGRKITETEEEADAKTAEIAKRWKNRISALKRVSAEDALDTFVDMLEKEYGA